MPPSPLESPDPSVRALAERRECVRREIAAIDAMFGAYAAGHSAARGLRCDAPVVRPLDHATMRDDDEACGCVVCVEWRLRRDEMDRAMRFVPPGHRWSICTCAPCRFAGRMHLNYVAAANVRDLAIEVAYHATWHSPHGEQVMAWLAGELRLPKYTTRWCAYEIGRRPVEEWLSRCEIELSPVLSGQVFMTGGGRRHDMQEWLPSSLGGGSLPASIAMD